MHPTKHVLPRQGETAMAVNVRQRKSPSGTMHWQADIRVRLPDGTLHRERPRAPGTSRAAALRWARQRELHIIRNGLQGKETTQKNKEVRKVPKFRDFAERYLTEYVEANAFAPSTRRNDLHDWEHTVIGRASFSRGKLRVESNSIERADELRARVEAVCRGLVKHRGREHADPDAMLDDLARSEPRWSSRPPRPTRSFRSTNPVTTKHGPITSCQRWAARRRERPRARSRGDVRKCSSRAAVSRL